MGLHRRRPGAAGLGASSPGPAGELRVGLRQALGGRSRRPGNSQHLTDWYTFSHLLDGFWLYSFLWLTFRQLPVGARLSLAVVWTAFMRPALLLARKWRV